MRRKTDIFRLELNVSNDRYFQRLSSQTGGKPN